MGHNSGQVRLGGTDLLVRGLSVAQVALLNDILCIAGAAQHAISNREKERVIVLIKLSKLFLLFHNLPDFPFIASFSYAAVGARQCRASARHGPYKMHTIKFDGSFVLCYHSLGRVYSNVCQPKRESSKL